MTLPTNTGREDKKAWPEYLPDRYDRLKGAAEEWASGADFGDSFIDADMVRAFAKQLSDCRVLDGLSEHDADTISLLVVIDFSQGLSRMAWRITDWLSESRSVTREDDDEFAVTSVLARVLAIVCAAFAGEEFEIAQQHFSPTDVADKGGAK